MVGKEGAGRRGGGARRFPQGFLWGSATAAHQVEGGNSNDWTQWEAAPGHIGDATVSGLACDHYMRYREDIATMAALGHTSYRFSLEWSRIEPVDGGPFDADALRHYADVIATCRAHGIEPLVTLQHFTLPTWLADRGGVLADDAAERFAKYARACADALGSDVRWWVTINEPNVLAQGAYSHGGFPPGQRSFPATRDALAAMVGMHAAAATAVRASYTANAFASPMVSVAHNERPQRPANPRSQLDRQAAAAYNHFFNRAFLDSCQTGRLVPPLGNGEPVPGGTLDYLGVNYYSDELRAFDATNPVFGYTRVAQTLWAPPGKLIERAMEDLWKHYKLPILITENGTAAPDPDRINYLVDVLSGVHDAIAKGVKVLGYTHWATMDNFEWNSGFACKMGFIAIDRTTMARTIKPSGRVFREIARGNAIPARLLKGRDAPSL